jgi:hypothetical protein
MCQSFGGTPAGRLRLRDEAVGYDVDMACRMAVFYHEQDAERVRLDAMSLGAFSRATGGGGGGESSFFGPEAEEYLNQTSSKLGDM